MRTIFLVIHISSGSLALLAGPVANQDPRCELRRPCVHG